MVSETTITITFMGTIIIILLLMVLAQKRSLKKLRNNYDGEKDLSRQGEERARAGRTERTRGHRRSYIGEQLERTGSAERDEYIEEPYPDTSGKDEPPRPELLPTEPFNDSGKDKPKRKKLGRFLERINRRRG